MNIDDTRASYECFLYGLNSSISVGYPETNLTMYTWCQQRLNWMSIYTLTINPVQIIPKQTTYHFLLEQCEYLAGVLCGTVHLPWVSLRHILHCEVILHTWTQLSLSTHTHTQSYTCTDWASHQHKTLSTRSWTHPQVKLCIIQSVHVAKALGLQLSCGWNKYGNINTNWAMVWLVYIQWRCYPWCGWGQPGDVPDPSWTLVGCQTWAWMSPNGQRVVNCQYIVRVWHTLRSLESCLNTFELCVMIFCLTMSKN